MFYIVAGTIAAGAAVAGTLHCFCGSKKNSKTLVELATETSSAPSAPSAQGNKKPFDPTHSMNGEMTGQGYTEEDRKAVIKSFGNIAEELKAKKFK